jgi:hypothetical protein
MLCFISIPSLGVKIHVWGQYFRNAPYNSEQNILFAKNTFYSSFSFLEVLHHLRPYIYIYIYIHTHTHTHTHTEQVFKTAILGSKILIHIAILYIYIYNFNILIHITIIVAPERAILKTCHF